MKLLFFFLSLHSLTFAADVLVVDGAFAPLKTDQITIGYDQCPIASENGKLKEKMGKCYSEHAWKELDGLSPHLLKGLMNSLSKDKEEFVSEWNAFETNNKEKAKEIKMQYILNSHGSRSAYILAKNSNTSSHIYPLRMISSQVGTTKQDENYSIVEDLKNETPFSKDCSLKKISTEKTLSLNKGKDFLPYQQAISKMLKAHPTIKIISISLGYKKSWISEDNAKCPPTSVNAEYNLLKSTWKNLLSLYKDKLFVVAAGNENVNFDEANNRNDDLWASLDEQKNLILVGSNTVSGDKFSSSNYGKNVLMVLGEKIPVLSPLPKDESYPTEVRGTSFSAPLVAAMASQLWSQKSKASAKEIRALLFKNIGEPKK